MLDDGETLDPSQEDVFIMLMDWDFIDVSQTTEISLSVKHYNAQH